MSLNLLECKILWHSSFPWHFKAAACSNHLLQVAVNPRSLILPVNNPPSHRGGTLRQTGFNYSKDATNQAKRTWTHGCYGMSVFPSRQKHRLKRFPPPDLLTEVSVPVVSGVSRRYRTLVTPPKSLERRPVRMKAGFECPARLELPAERGCSAHRFRLL